MELDDIQKILNDLSTRFDLINTAKKSCGVVIIDLVQKGEDKIGGFEPSELIYEFKSQKFVFNYYLREEPFISTEIGIYTMPIYLQRQPNAPRNP